MKKTLLVILALVMALTLAVGAVSTVSAAAPPTITGGGTYSYAGSTLGGVVTLGSIAINARQINADTGEATGWVNLGRLPGTNFNAPAAEHATFAVSYMALSKDGTVWWLGTTLQASSPLPGTPANTPIYVDFVVNFTTNQFFYGPAPEDPSQVVTYAAENDQDYIQSSMWYQINNGSISINTN